LDVPGAFPISRASYEGVVSLFGGGFCLAVV